MARVHANDLNCKGVYIKAKREFSCSIAAFHAFKVFHVKVIFMHDHVKFEFYSKNMK